MNFTHSDEQRMLAATLERYLADCYGFETRMQIARSTLGYSAAHWNELADLGAIAVLFPERDGGLGGSGFDIALVFEALGRALSLEPFLPMLLAGSAIAHAGNPQQRALLAQMLAGHGFATLAHEEPLSRYEPARVQTRAHRDGGHWVLNGHKAVVPLGQQAQWLVVSARSAGADGEAEGISLFLLPGDSPGLGWRGYPTHDGGRGAELHLTQLRLPAAALLGAEGTGLHSLAYALDRGVLALCAEALGAMECAKQHTLEYLRTRRQFGAPIGSFQALQHRMAELLLEIEQARSAVINAAAALEAPTATRARTLSAAKYSIGRIGARVAEECIQFHGGIGMSWELPLAHYAKRLVLIDHQLGDEDHHLARYIALGRH